MATSTPWLIYFWIAIVSFLSVGRAQFPPPISNETTTLLTSPINSNVTIRYKSVPNGTCTTVFSTQKQYSGYITLPPDVLDPNQGNYTINTFFWFFEARQLPETAPLTIFINGGPGSSSMVGLFQEVGPCHVVELSDGLLGTVAREWGWDRSSNILFIDQPVQVGFSYDTPTNISLNLLDESITTPPTDPPASQPSFTFLNGTFGSGNPAFTANTSSIAAQSMWHFLQTFLTSFPEYNTAMRRDNNHSTAEIHLFTESYGGRYGPTAGSFFKAQNRRRNTDPAFANRTIELTLSSLGIINGWIDLLIQTPYYPRFAYQNSYGVQTISQLQQLNALSAFNGADGCRQLTARCRAEQVNLDPEGAGDIDLVNEACSRAQFDCQVRVIGPYTSSGRSIYDITQNMLDPFPNPFYLEYLNQLSVQQAISVPVNYTQDSLAVFNAFNTTGDYARSGIIEDLVELLASGTRIALIYGDRDYICNWLGGEAISFAIAAAAGPSYAPWYSAGYAPIVANDTYIGGVVRQYGNLSFSRIYDAGHLVPAYQPETAFTVFSRVIKGTELSMGSTADLSTYRSDGEPNSTHTNPSPPPMAAPTCFIRAMNATCNVDQKNMVANNAGVIINGVLYARAEDWHGPNPQSTSAAGVPGTPPPPSLMPSATTASRSSSSSSTAHLNGTSPGSASRDSSSSGNNDPSENTASTMTTSSSPPSSPSGTTTRLPTGVYTATGIPTTSPSPSPGARAQPRMAQQHRSRNSMFSLSPSPR